MKPIVITVAVAELKEADMEVIRTMEICPSCGTEAKSGVYWHLMCYRCIKALPWCVNYCVDREPPSIMLERFVFWMKLLGRTHVLLAERGEAASEAVSLPAVQAPKPAAPAALVAQPPPPAPEPRRSSRRGDRALEEAEWETMWREGCV